MKNNIVPNGFIHPGNNIFEECARTFETSSFGDGGVLLYTNEHGNRKVISGGNGIIELQKVCSPCPKYQGCLVHETLLNVLIYINQKNNPV